jgi:hypothetical protein
MKKIYHVQCDAMEVEGMFDEDGKLLGAWCLNHANWRGEYFNSFMKATGIKVVKSSKKEYVAELQKFLE